MACSILCLDDEDHQLELVNQAFANTESRIPAGDIAVPSLVPRQARLNIYILLLQFGLLALAPAAMAQDAEVKLETAQWLLQEGKWEEAIRNLEGLVQENKLRGEPRLTAQKYLGVGYLLLGQEDKALEVFKRLLRVDPTFIHRQDALTVFGAEQPMERLELLLGRAHVEVQQELQQNGTETSEDEAALKPVLSLFREGQWEDAIRRLEELVQGDELHGTQRLTAQKYLGVGYLLLGQEDQALEVFKRLLRVDPTFIHRQDALTVFGSEQPMEPLGLLLGRAYVEIKQEFQQAVLAVLREITAENTWDFTKVDVLARISRHTGLAEQQTIVYSLDLLAYWNEQRKNRTNLWISAISLQESVSPRLADQFLRNLIQELQRILNKDGDYSLKEVLERTARKAGISPYQGHDLLVHMLQASQASRSQEQLVNPVMSRGGQIWGDARTEPPPLESRLSIGEILWGDPRTERVPPEAGLIVQGYSERQLGERMVKLIELLQERQGSLSLMRNLNLVWYGRRQDKDGQRLAEDWCRKVFNTVDLDRIRDQVADLHGMILARLRRQTEKSLLRSPGWRDELKLIFRVFNPMVVEYGIGFNTSLEMWDTGTSTLLFAETTGTTLVLQEWLDLAAHYSDRPIQSYYGRRVLVPSKQTALEVFAETTAADLGHFLSAWADSTRGGF